MAWRKRRNPVRGSFALDKGYNNTTAIKYLTEYECPYCGAPPEMLQVVIVQWAGTLHQPYVPGMQLPANLQVPPTKATRSFGFKCRACGNTGSGSTSLTMGK